MRKPWWALCRPEAHYLLRLLRLVRRVFRRLSRAHLHTSPREVEIAPRSPTPRDASAGRSHVYQRAEHAKGISLAPGIVPKGPSRRARLPAAHRHQTPLGAPKPTSGGFGELSRGSLGQTEWSHWPFRTHTLGRGQWARQCSSAACEALPELVWQIRH